MLDFLKIATRQPKKGVIEIYPKFIIKKSEDLMIRGGDFYAIWVEERGMWSTEEQDALYLIDQELTNYHGTYNCDEDEEVRVLYITDSDTGMIDKWHKYCQSQMRDNFHMLDETLIFANTKTSKKDYSSKRLSYPLEPGECPAYDKMMSTLYSPEERQKIEWAIGAIVTGDSKKIQKFLVFYGAAGTGKSTVLHIVEQLFEGYHSNFDAKALGTATSVFALESFRDNPLVAIQHDGDLSRIEDNTRLNSLVSHETMTVNEKFKTTYANSFKAFLLMGTNKPVKITDGKSGLLRRLIDVHPTGKKLDIEEYTRLNGLIPFELGAIACHCRDVYLRNQNLFDTYIPTEMLGASNDFYNFVIDSYSVFAKENSTTLKAAWEMYKTYCDDAKVAYPYSQRNFREELKNYFWDFNEKILKEGGVVRNVYSRFRIDIFDPKEQTKARQEKPESWLKLSTGKSQFDVDCLSCPAQYANSNEIPMDTWDNVRTTLSDIDTSKLHYVRVPENHVVIDFDLKDSSGNKSFEKNVEAASKWPATYAELSKSGAGLHLHYLYSGDVSKLSRIYDDEIEVKVFTGKTSLRRKLTRCNDIPIATISSGLPLKGDYKVIEYKAIANEKALRTLIKKNLNKEYHASTKCSVDFIKKNLDDAHASGLIYDVNDLKPAVIAFAAQSTNQADYCLRLVGKMKFKSEEISEPVEDKSEEQPLVFFDVEVFPNLFLVNWKVKGEEAPVVRMINPKQSDIEELIKYRLVGYNCRRYDNHILYGCLMGYTNEQLFSLSQKIINSEDGGRNKAFFANAYDISYTDVYDFAAKKQSLKKWEIELGLEHKELGLPWDEPVPEEEWGKVAEYCDWDVLCTEKVFDHLKGDFTARKILADLADMSVNSTTNSLTTRIIFGYERAPKLVYTDLSETFAGYEYIEFGEDNRPHNIYRGTDMGFGGYIVSFPGIYYNVALLDLLSLHPNSIRAMNCFGKYTKNFTDLVDARAAIKHGEYESARKMFGGKLAKYLDDESTAKDLAQALKIAINSVYGLTAASFDNPFRDPRNKNNIVALRGALFMRTLQDEIVKKGYPIVAIKTDSVKIANADKSIIDFCFEFAKKYGYTFEFEAGYDRICQINDADYIARYKKADECENMFGYIPGDNKKHSFTWTATGTQFKVPYVFKSLFSKEKIVFGDLCETKSVKTVLYLDMNEKLPEGEHDYRFVGKVGLFCPVRPGCGGGELVRRGKDSDGNIKYYSATGAKGYRWLEAELIRGSNESIIDKSYYNTLVDKAVSAISEYGDFEQFVSDDTPVSPYFKPEEPFGDEDDLPF